MKEKSNKPDWNALFEQALTQPGVMSKAYSAFHEYSLGNAFLAASQLIGRGLPISPIASYKKWLELGRQVKKGEKAIALVMPVTLKSKSKEEGDDGEGCNEKSAQQQGSGRTIFILKNNWFALCQTDGAEYAQEVIIPKWDKARALAALGITEQNFSSMSGNTQGYAIPNEKKLAINPLAALPWKTTFHEIAQNAAGAVPGVNRNHLHAMEVCMGVSGFLCVRR